MRASRLFDTADIYGQGLSEEFLGAGPRHASATRWSSPRSSGWTCRARTVPTGEPGDRAVTSGAPSNPRCGGSGPTGSTSTNCTRPIVRTPIAETLGALTELVHEGKVRYIGCSNFAGWQVADADWTARPAGLERFISAQNHYNLLNRAVETELVPACEQFGLGILPYFPLASGLLSGKYRRGEAAPEGTRLAGRARRSERRALRRQSRSSRHSPSERGLSLLQVAIGGSPRKRRSRRSSPVRPNPSR